jgi:hypothetical protein
MGLMADGIPAARGKTRLLSATFESVMTSDKACFYSHQRSPDSPRHSRV